jgi:hypothetical protein
MNEFELYAYVKKDVYMQHRFKGVYAIDKLPAIMKTFPYYIILNTSKSDIKTGHWTVLYFVNYHKVLFFDSYGRKYTDVENGNILNDYLINRNVKSFEYKLQSYKSNVCGYYCIYTVYKLCRNIMFKDMYTNFTVDVEYNDSMIVYIVNCILSV